MAEKRISELSDAALPLAVGSLFGISEPTGTPGAYQSRKIAFNDLINSFGLSSVAFTGAVSDLDENSITIGSTAITLGDTVTLLPADVGLGNVDNTSDLNKPVSTAQQTALDLKANLASPALSGTPTAPTASAGTNSTQIATTAYTDTAVGAIIAAADAMVFKGTIDCSTNPNYPAANRGDTYRVSVAGKIGGASGVNVEIGDILICLTDGTASGTHAAVGASWTIIQSNLDGAVIGPASAIDSQIAAFNGTSGKLIKDGGIATNTLVTLAGSQTLTNKTLTAPILSGSISGTYTLGGTPTLSGGTISGTTTLPGSGQINSSGWIGIGATPLSPFHVERGTNGSVVQMRHSTFSSNPALEITVFNTGSATLTSGSILSFATITAGVRVALLSNGDFRQGTGAALATTVVDGFLLLATCAGVPTGVPTNAGAGQIPMIFNKTANVPHFYNTAWLAGVSESAAGTINFAYALGNGAAAAAGTLTNAPVAGNPTKWIPFNDNGTTRYVPAW